jgi:prolyl 4-hydroxylase
MSEWSPQQPIDWARLAEPQPDEYDVDVALWLASTTTSPGRPHPYVRTLAGDSPLVFDGKVAIRHVYRSSPEFDSISRRYPDGPVDHPNIPKAAEYVRAWPLAFAQCQRLLEAIHPATDPEKPLESVEIYRGASSHSLENLFGTMWATIYCPISLAEAIVHEMAHQKLRALGVSFESATSIVGNDPSELYESPIIKDRLRPMTAVLHAEYSYVHVTELDVHMLRAERDPARRAVLWTVLDRNLRRIEEGYGTIRKQIEPGEHGREFIGGLFEWVERIVDAAKDVLGRSGKSPSRGTDRSTGAGRAVKSLPDIDTSCNVIHTPDRQIEVLLTVNSPRIVLLGNVLSDEECDALAAYCKPRMFRSIVADQEDGRPQVDPTRTSQDAMVKRGENELVKRIEARLSALSHWPVERTENLQVLRYGAGEEFRAHFDWLNPDEPGPRHHLQFGGQRLATFIVYLSNVEAGGRTSFPAVGLEVAPRKGCGLFFLNTDSRCEPDRLALHAAMPVIKGVKFIANKWLRERDC